MGIPYAEVIGDPIAQSKSPLVHKYWLEQLGIEGDYRATRVTDHELPAYLAGRLADPDWRGCNVTMPHKQNILLLLDAVSDEDIGAVNCIVPEAGRLVGRNTDAPGFLAALAAVPPPDEPASGDHVATYFHLIGAGGAARAVAAALRGRDIVYFNRDAEKAEALAEEFGPGGGYGFGLGLDALNGPSLRHEDQRCSYIVVNASSMGMADQPPVPINLSLYPDDSIVCDLVYHPLETPLLAEARRLGMRTVDGLAMLIGQARFAFEYFFGVAPPDGDVELRKLLTS
jgi:shikimate dehydrogenase